jgi:hypothetical protein
MRHQHISLQVFKAKGNQCVCGIVSYLVLLLCVCRVDQQDAWLRQQVAAHPGEAYWQVQGLLLAQLDGLYDGYNAAMAAAEAAGTLPAGEWLSRESIMFLNSNGERSLQQQQQQSDMQAPCSRTCIIVPTLRARFSCTSAAVH